MSEIKTRAEAKEASIEKWVDILTRIGNLQSDIDTMCGFCDLARDKAEGKEPPVFKCAVCEPDAKKLCEEYITGGFLITEPLSNAWMKTNILLTQIRSLPVDLK